jgi:hypothetical protein
MTRRKTAIPRINRRSAATGHAPLHGTEEALPRGIRWAMVAGFHLFPMLVLLYGFSLYWDRLHYNDPSLERSVEIVAVRETWEPGRTDPRPAFEQRREARLTPEERDAREQGGWSLWHIVAYTDNAGNRHEAEFDQPPQRPLDIGDRVVVRYHSADPARVILFDGPSDLWAAPGVILGVGIVVNLLVLIATWRLLPR